MHKSIMQEWDGRCYLCELLDQDYSEKPTEVHHVFYGTANRALSDRYGLIVRLCKRHHTLGKDSIHGGNRAVDLMLKQRAQAAFEKHYPDLDFRSIFGKSYL